MTDITGRHVRVGIDVGTSTTVACLRRGTGPITPLLFDASPLLSSAVLAAADGRLLTGADAVRAAAARPEAFEPNPKRRIDDATVWLGDRAVAVVELLASVLRRVSDEARRVAGTAPDEVVLTCPAGWGATRRAVLAGAARRAGLGEVRLIREPVAAAAYFADFLHRPLPPGKCLVVYDFGAGTFDVSVVRVLPGGVQVLAADGLSDVGGNDLDALIVGIVRTAVPSDAWGRMDWPSTPEDRRGRRLLWSDARAAKEQLSRHSTADVHLPLADRDVHVTREEFEHAARGTLDRTVKRTVETLRSAGVGRAAVGGVLLVGGSSRVPLVAGLVHRALGVAPTIIEQPELVVAYGSLYATPRSTTAATPPQPHVAPAVAPVAPAVPAAAPSGDAATAARAVGEVPDASAVGEPSAVPPAGSPPAPPPLAPEPPAADTTGRPDTGTPGGRAPAPPDGTAPAPRRRRRTTLSLSLAGVLLIAAAAAVWSLQRDQPRRDAEAAPRRGATTAASVLPAASGSPSASPSLPPPTGQPTASATVTGSPGRTQTPAQSQPLRSVSKRTPGCGESNARIAWTPVRGDLSCSGAAATLTKRVGWDEGGYLQSYAELRMSVRDQQFPAAYTVSFTVGGLSAPSVTANRGGCGGLAVHISPDDHAFDYFNVCRDGWVELVSVPDSGKLDQPHQVDQLTPDPDDASFDVVVTATAGSTTARVQNHAGQSVAVSLPAVAATTTYVALVTTWRDAGATASFSNFTYRADA